MAAAGGDGLELELEKFSFHTWKDFFNMSDLTQAESREVL